MIHRFALGIALALTLGTVARAQSTENPHGTLKDACGTCHTANGWKSIRVAPTFQHAPRTFPLDGAHERVSCAGCHKALEFTKAPATCSSCHEDVHKGEFGVTCSTCHTTRSFVDRASMQRAHELTRFPLRGAHMGADCSACHTPTPAGRGQFVNTSTVCYSCHNEDYRRAATPNHVSAQFPTDCASCHTPVSWTGAGFDHARTQFPLTGAHIAQTCTACHGDKVFAGKPTECVACHRQDYDASKNPPHATGFPTDCASCHTTQSFTGSSFAHTKFALTGAHATTLCSACHGDNVFTGKAQTCVSCHQLDYNGTSNPQHAAAGFATTCADCHNTTSYRGAMYDHSKTRFPLTGAHNAAGCAACHANNVYRGTPIACGSCHLSDYNATTNPAHATSGFPTTCENCHSSTTAWSGGRFDHGATSFPLTGAHLTATCMECHSDNVFDGKPTTCVSCHLASYNATTNPNHSAAGYSTNCTSCHTTAQWLGATFDHATTAFPLTGAHMAVSCATCHVNGVYKGTPTACVSCHQTDFNSTTSPHHVQAGFSTTCTTCHTTNPGWKAPYDHNLTSFPLTGAHLTATCLDCHADKVYNGKPTTCVSCHLANYNATTNPSHTAAGYSTNCTSCHSTTQWLGATFDHATTAFPLTGAHLAVSCTSCHVNGVYKGTPTTCLSCHQTDYNGTTNPHHVQAAFSTTCTSCHTTNPGWRPATYDHNQTSFPLTGAHLTATCLDCHADKVYNGKPTTCVSCHLTDYNNTTNPRHATAGFPTDCAACHTTTRWLGATFNHDGQFFPIYSGKHQGKWNTCADCHINTSNYQVFECILCHQHSDKTKTDADHTQVSGYQYKSTSCYACHPRGD